MIGMRLWQIAGWTMLHYLWVGAAVGAPALLARQRLLAAGANARYLAALGSLVLLSVAPVPIAVWVAQKLVPLPPDNRLVAEAVALPKATGRPALRPTSIETVAPLPVAVGDLSDQGSQTRSAERPWTAVDRAAMYLPWLWLCGTPLSFALTMAGLLGADRLRRQSRVLEDGRITELCRQLAVSLNLSYGVSVAVCDRLAAPILLGVLRPMIVLPAAALAGLDPRQLEMVLLHELAHVRRLDNLVNLLQRVVESLLFFQPMVWIVSAWVRREREYCCDELVVRRTRQPHVYAELLVAWAEKVSASASRGPIFAQPPTVSSLTDRPLVARVRRILKREEQAMQVSRKAAGGVVASLLVLAVLIGGYSSLPSYADNAVPESKEASSRPPAEQQK